MGFTEKQLSQLRENSTNAARIYSPPISGIGIIKSITLANTSGAAAIFSLFLDDDGTTYDETTALAWNVAIEADEMIQLDGYYPMNDSDGNFAYKSSVANAITITLFGAEVT